MPMEDNGVPSFKRDKYLFFRSRRNVDLLSLDEEVSEIASLVQDVAECTAQAVEIREAAKDELEKTKATLAEKLRRVKVEDGEKGRREKSETTIASQILLDPLLEEKQIALAEARYDAALWSSLVEAMRTKYGAIKVVAELMALGYTTQSHILAKRREELRKE